MEKKEIRDDFIHVPPSEDKTIGNRLSRIAVECEISKDGGLDAFQETYVKKELITLIERELEKAREEGLKDLKQELFTFFRWFQWNGEKYMDKPIEEMIKAYLEERKLGDVLGKIEEQIKLEEDKNEGA